MFVGVLDFGFFANALIATENAVRTAGLYYAGSQQQATDVTQACYYALEVLREEPNVKGDVTTCLATPSVTQTNPVALFASSPSSGPDGEPSVTVTVVYATVTLIPIPGVLSGQLNISRTVQFKQQNDHA